MVFSEKTLKKEVIYAGSFLTLSQHEVLLENGKTSTRDIVEHDGAVAVLALTPDNKMVFVRQYRKGVEMETLEIPAGKLDSKQEYPLMAAKRELNEETNYESEEWQKLVDMAVTPAYSSEIITIYLAKNITPAKHHLGLDDDEFLAVELLTLEQAVQKVAAGDICDAKTLYAVQYWQLLNQ